MRPSALVKTSTIPTELVVLGFTVIGVTGVTVGAADVVY